MFSQPDFLYPESGPDDFPELINTGSPGVLAGYSHAFGLKVCVVFGDGAVDELNEFVVVFCDIGYVAESVDVFGEMRGDDWFASCQVFVDFERIDAFGERGLAEWNEHAVEVLKEVRKFGDFAGPSENDIGQFVQANVLHFGALDRSDEKENFIGVLFGDLFEELKVGAILDAAGVADDLFVGIDGLQGFGLGKGFGGGPFEDVDVCSVGMEEHVFVEG